MPPVTRRAASHASGKPPAVARPSKRKRSTPVDLPTEAKEHPTQKQKRSTSPEKTSTHVSPVKNTQQSRSDKKVQAWSKHATTSPYPQFTSPTEHECRVTYQLLDAEHGETVSQNFADDISSVSYPHVLDGVTVATLSQATSWSNAKRAMASMKRVYGSPFAYADIVRGGVDKLAAALRPGGMHNRKSRMLLKILDQVKERHGDWDLDHLFRVTDDEEAAKELISYDGIGPKSAYCVLSICLQRKLFAVDTHIYRISGLWGWRPAHANRDMAQAHLDARIPNDIKFALHYLLIVHGRECPTCRGGYKGDQTCTMRQAIKHQLAVASPKHE